MHSLRYIGIISDEDSSVYTKVVEIVPYGHRLKNSNVPITLSDAIANRYTILSTTIPNGKVETVSQN